MDISILFFFFLKVLLAYTGPGPTSVDAMSLVTI